MVSVSAAIDSRDRKIGAMVKALAFDVSGATSVAGASQAVLESTGRLSFSFPSDAKADEFRTAVRNYLPAIVAQVAD